jgi:SAM-dependent methyltransferase
LLKTRLRRWIADLLSRDGRPLDVLAYGDGLGFDSLYLAQRGHHVRYFEVSQKCQAFARKLFDRAGASIRILIAAEPPQGAAFDAVLCLDVLEHVPQPEELVRRLAGYVRPGGRLIVSAPFHYTTKAVGTHLMANRKYCGDLKRLFGPCGLVLADGRFFWDPIVLVKPAPGVAVQRASRSRLALVRCGGLLLAVARWWNLPHNLVTQWLVRASP